MKIVTLLQKNADPPKRVVDFPLERDTFRNKIAEIVRKSTKKLQQQRETLEIIDDFSRKDKKHSENVEDVASIFCIFLNVSSFFHFSFFLVFSFPFFLFCKFFFVFPIFLFSSSCSFSQSSEQTPKPSKKSLRSSLCKEDDFL